MPDLSALQVYLRGLNDTSLELRKASSAAIGGLRDQAAPVLDQLAKRNELSPAVLPELRLIYSRLKSDQSLAHSRSVPHPVASPGQDRTDRSTSLRASREQGADESTGSPLPSRIHGVRWTSARSTRTTIICRRSATPSSPAPPERTAQLTVGSDDTLSVWLNGKQVYDFQDRRGFTHEQDCRDVSLELGVNRVLIRCGNRGGPWQFSVAVSGAPEHAFLKGPATPSFNPDLYRAAAIKAAGQAEHGRALFFDLKGLACIKCHAVGKEGGAVGPELSSVGAKYPRDELITAVLYPSAKISSGYEPTVLGLADGRVLTGIIKAETDDAVEIQDADTKLVRIPKADIEDRKRSDVSIMPSGLAQGLSPTDFADLIRYLESLKNQPASPLK